MLGAEPDLGVRKGETFMNRGAVGSVITANTGKWHLGTGVREPCNVSEQIAELLNRVPDDPHVWTELTNRFVCFISVGAWFIDDSWTGGLTIEPRTLGMLAERGLAIDFDMYAPAASD